MKEMLRKNKRFVLITIILVLITAITTMITPILLQTLYRGEGGFNPNIFGLVILCMTVSYLLQLSLLIYRENFSAKFNLGNTLLLFHKMFRMKYDALIKLEPSYLVNRIFTAVDSLYLFFGVSFSSIASSAFIIVASLVLVFPIHWTVGGALLALLPLNYFGFRYINQELKQKIDNSQQKSAAAMKDLMTTMKNIDSLKQMADYKPLEHLIAPSLREMYHTLADTNKFAQGTSSFINFINQLAQNVLYIGVSYFVAIGSLQISNIVIISIIIPIYFAAVGNLTRVNLDYKSLEASENFIHHELEQNAEPEPTGETQSLTTIDKIQIKTPAFHLNGSLMRFDVDAEFMKGDIVYVEGDSGSGKSTLLKLLLQFRESEGVYVNDHPIHHFEPSAIRKRTSFISQETTILSKTIADNIGFGTELTEADKLRLHHAGILDPILTTKTWNSLITENGANLSGGEKQRIAIARMLIEDSDVLILDEATSSIDKASSDAILGSIVRQHSDKIIFITSHDQDNRKYANKLLRVRTA